MKNTIFLIIIAVILAGCNTSPNEPEQRVAFSANQCEQEPWNAWYETGEIQFVAEPSQEELIETYYSQEYEIVLTNIEQVMRNETVCQACNICPKSYYFQAQISSDNLEEIQTLGWNIS